VQVVAAVSFQPRLKIPLRNVIGDDEGSVGYSIRGIENYIPQWQELPESINFMDVQAIVSQSGDVLIGWSWEQIYEKDAEFTSAMKDYSGEHTSLKWDLNPVDKTTARCWQKTDRICILGSH